MARLKERTATLLAVLAGTAWAALYILFGWFVGWEYILGVFPIITIATIIVATVLWILGLGKEKKG